MSSNSASDSEAILGSDESSDEDLSSDCPSESDGEEENTKPQSKTAAKNQVRKENKGVVNKSNSAVAAAISSRRKSEVSSVEPIRSNKIARPNEKKPPLTASSLTSSTSSSMSAAPSAVKVNVSSSTTVDITRGPPIATDIAAKKLIMQYLKLQNRPYSAIQIFDNLHHRIPKPTVERVCTSLSQTGGGVICKEYGKAKIYFVDQSTLPSNVSEQQLSALHDENEELRSRIQEQSNLETQARNCLQQLLQEPTDDDLDR